MASEKDSVADLGTSSEVASKPVDKANAKKQKEQREKIKANIHASINTTNESRNFWIKFIEDNCLRLPEERVAELLDDMMNSGPRIQTSEEVTKIRCPDEYLAGATKALARIEKKIKHEISGAFTVRFCQTVVVIDSSAKNADVQEQQSVVQGQVDRNVLGLSSSESEIVQDSNVTSEISSCTEPGVCAGESNLELTDLRRGLEENAERNSDTTENPTEEMQAVPCGVAEALHEVGLANVMDLNPQNHPDRIVLNGNENVLEKHTSLDLGDGADTGVLPILTLRDAIPQTNDTYEPYPFPSNVLFEDLISISESCTEDNFKFEVPTKRRRTDGQVIDGHHLPDNEDPGLFSAPE